MSNENYFTALGVGLSRRAKEFGAIVKAVKPVKKKGKISPEGMANIISATQARWAKIRAAKSIKKK